MDAGKQRPLNRTRILRAAVRLVDRHGLEALSMRRLARELSVAPMSLYNHVAGKDALLDGIVGTVLTEIPLPGGSPEWPEAARRYVQGFRRAALRHPHVLPLLAARPPRTPEALQPVETAFEPLRRRGFDDETIAGVYRLLAGWAIGFVSLEVGGFFRSPSAPRDRPDGERPAGEVGRKSMAWDCDREFEVGLELIISGVRASLARERRVAPRRGGSSASAPAPRG